MLMKPPTLPQDYVPAVHADELVRVLEAIHKATSAGSVDGAHEVANRLASDALKKVDARAQYDAKFDGKTRVVDSQGRRLTPVGAGDGNTFAVG